MLKSASKHKGKEMNQVEYLAKLEVLREIGRVLSGDIVESDDKKKLLAELWALHAITNTPSYENG